ncbi:hypothetical protein [Lysobacter capsici]|uniref:hypothetical protein n=1 Tax=Lysobacter capsici TaxID=435897 RepID=UPI001C008A53|nr:hypothetical protein [Lysobacter capsici]QWF18241.1 hypothetical protein KME82_05600 [Lysobacter capsici]
MQKIFRAFIGPTGFRTARVYEGGGESSHYGAFVCDALESDLQSAESCQEHLGHVMAVLRGELDALDFSGNAYLIEVDRAAVTFSNQLTEDKGGEISTYEYLSILGFWLKFFESGMEPVEGVIAENIEDALVLTVRE